jgi:hypothetical protein
MEKDRILIPDFGLRVPAGRQGMRNFQSAISNPQSEIERRRGYATAYRRNKVYQVWRLC